MYRKPNPIIVFHEMRCMIKYSIILCIVHHVHTYFLCFERELATFWDKNFSVLREKFLNFEKEISNFEREISTFQREEGSPTTTLVQIAFEYLSMKSCWENTHVYYIQIHCCKIVSMLTVNMFQVFVLYKFF